MCVFVCACVCVCACLYVYVSKCGFESIRSRGGSLPSSFHASTIIFLSSLTFALPKKKTRHSLNDKLDRFAIYNVLIGISKMAYLNIKNEQLHFLSAAHFLRDMLVLVKQLNSYLVARNTFFTSKQTGLAVIKQSGTRS